MEGNLGSPWYGAVPSFRVPFYDRVRIYGYGFQQFFVIFGFMGMVCCKSSFIGEPFGMSCCIGMLFRNFSRFTGIHFSNFSGFMGGTFAI